MNKPPHQGSITIEFGAFPEKHEISVAKIFRKHGCQVRFLAPLRIKDAKTPDFEIDGVLWELKAPLGSSRNTVQNNLKKAGKQSKNIIFDTRRTKLSDDFIKKEINNVIAKTSAIQRLKLVDKDGEILDILKK